MRILRIDPEAGRPVVQFESREARIQPLARLGAGASVHWLTIGPQGVLGYHRAAGPQLFLAADGAGWVRGEGTERVAIAAGQAVFWEQGEGHESGSETGLTAFVIEGEGLDPRAFPAT